MPFSPDYTSTRNQTEDLLSSISKRLDSIEQIMKEFSMRARPFQGRNLHAHEEVFSAHEEVFSIDPGGIHIPPQLRVQHTTKKDRELENLRAQDLQLKRELSVKNDTIITLQKKVADQERLLDAYAHTSDWD